VAKDILVAWIVTMPAAGLIAAVFYLLAEALHIS
jgi:phosphate/sulfate permease